MASVNKVILVGNLGADPETRYSANGDAICNIRLATTDKWRDKASGEQKEMTEWHRVSFYGKLAEIAGQYLRKGSQVYVEGSLRTRKWQDQSGQDRYSTEIRADQMQMLGSRQGMGGDAPPMRNEGGYSRQPQEPRDNGFGGGAPAAAPASRKPAAPSGGFGDFDDDIPF